MPIDFNRKPRSFSELERWKATEYRQFLLFIMSVIYKKCLCDAQYNMIMLYFVAITLLTREDLYSKYIDYAEQLLLLFVKDCDANFGKEFIVSYLHNLIHLAEKVRRFGPLDKFSGFIFKNYLQVLKKAVKNSTNPLQQIYNRLSEIDNFLISSPVASMKTKLVPNKKTLDNLFFKATYNGTIFSINNKDNFFLLKEKSVVSIDHFKLESDQLINFVCKKFCNPIPLFTYPCSSEKLSIYLFTPIKQNALQYTYNIDRIHMKGVVLPLENNVVFIQLNSNKNS